MERGEPDRGPVRPRRRAALLVPGFALALLIHALVYGGSLSNGFTFDDAVILVSGPEVNGSAPLAGAFARPYFPKGSAAAALDYRPVTLVSLGVDVRLFGLSPAAVHALNVAWAAAGASLLGLLVLEVGGGGPAALLAAAAGLLLASLHPARSEAILSGVGRSELLALAFTSAALLLARRSFPGGAGRSRAWIASGASGALLLLALGSKESAFAAPAVLALLLLVDPDSPLAAGSAPRRSLRSLVPLFASWGLALAIALLARYAVLGGLLAGPSAVVDPSDNPLAALPFAARLPSALALVPLAAARVLFPRTLVADYGSGSLAQLLAAPAGPALLGLALLGASVSALALLARRVPAAALAIGWGLLAWVPFANILFPTGTVFAERLLYVPSTCAAFAAAGLGGALAARAGRAGRNVPSAGIRPAALLLGPAALLGLLGGARILARVPEWRDDGALFAAAVRDCPGNGRASLNLGLLSLSAGDAPGAAARLGAALAADPSLRPRVLALLAHAERLGRPDLAAAIRGALDRPDR